MYAALNSYLTHVFVNAMLRSTILFSQKLSPSPLQIRRSTYSTHHDALKSNVTVFPIDAAIVATSVCDAEGAASSLKLVGAMAKA